MSEEEKKEYEELKSLLYTGTISQYGKRKLIYIIEKQSKEIEELKIPDLTTVYLNGVYDGEKKVKDKIKAEIEELQEDIKYSANPLSIDNSKFGIKVLQSLLEKKLPTTITKEELEKRWKGVENMEEIIKEELEKYYEFLNIDVEYIKIRTYNIYVSISLTDYKNEDIIKAVQFEFTWDIRGTNESNLNQLKYKINKAIIKFFIKERGE